MTSAFAWQGCVKRELHVLYVARLLWVRMSAQQWRASRGDCHTRPPWMAEDDCDSERNEDCFFLIRANLALFAIKSVDSCPVSVELS